MIEKKLLSIFDTCDQIEAALGPRVEARTIRESAAVLVCDLWMRQLLIIKEPLDFCGMTQVKPGDLEAFVPEPGELESMFEAWPEVDD
jgi:hypothetical protein